MADERRLQITIVFVALVGGYLYYLFRTTKNVFDDLSRTVDASTLDNIGADASETRPGASSRNRAKAQPDDSRAVVELNLTPAQRSNKVHVCRTWKTCIVSTFLASVSKPLSQIGIPISAWL
ncbi:hypothetical protein MVEN_00825000 [Mycena venus]|uniref:Uncharacterized protein n=1 Tax=Mycena venus TaxID=2733690 RepID=A0A8H7D189_9AGAR|nr:hypothetical protein MVEN_00825000 [Mycena venus]